MPVEVLCEVCGCTFDVKPYREDSATYCSKSCQSKSQEKQFVEISCYMCDELFEVKPSRSDSAKYCSRECYYSARSDEMSVEDAPGWRGGRKVTLSCEFCDGKFERYESAIEGGSAVRFCSNECKYKFLSDELSEPGTEIRHSAEYRNWRESVKQRDGECVSCGSTERLHAHHIIPIEEDEELATEIDNGKTLCARCHADRHPEVAELIMGKTYTDS